MKTIKTRFTSLFSLMAISAALNSFAAAPVIENIHLVPQLTIQSDVGRTNQIQYATDLAQTNWQVLTNITIGQSPYLFFDVSAPPAPKRFYRVIELPTNTIPTGMALIPAGAFLMGDSLDGDPDALPRHQVTVSAFYVDKNLVTFALWQQVYQWATNHGYKFDNAGLGKAADHPVHTVNWFDVAKWCNARSEMEGLAPCYFTSASQTNLYRIGHVTLLNTFVDWTASGYRLPTEAEWEKAARGGAEGHRFPWSDVETIDHTRANYYAQPVAYPYDVSPMAGLDPRFSVGSFPPYTSPVGSFPPNGYGLYDMAGNLYEWVWDSFSPYGSAAQTNPKGETIPGNRSARGGTWCCDVNFSANGCRVAYRAPGGDPAASGYGLGFRSLRSAAP